MSAWRRSMYSTRKMSEHPSPPYNWLDTGEAAEAAEVAEAVGEAAAGEGAFRFGGEVAAAAAAAEVAEAAGAGAIEEVLTAGR
jgi:hypothetical protein